MTPLIGITPNIIRHESWAPLQYGQNDTYVRALFKVGGLPIIVPLTDDHTVLREIYDKLDGLVLAGGEDIYSPPDLRDRTELKLAEWALADNLPTLGTCRGLQILNHQAGGALHEDISMDFPDALDHNSSRAARDMVHIAREIAVDPDSRLCEILGVRSIGINEYHHQSIKTLGNGFKAVGWTDDGVIEAIEHESKNFCFAVQCHPEGLVSENAEPRWEPLFDAFITAAAQYKMRVS